MGSVVHQFAMAMARGLLPLLVISVCFVSDGSCRRLERSFRPSYAGITGGTVGSYVGQIIPPGTPWPSKAEDYSTTRRYYNIPYGQISSSIGTKTTDAFPQTVTLVDGKDDSSGTSTLQHSSSSSQPPSRPSFAGSTGGKDVEQSTSSILNKEENSSTDTTTQEHSQAQTETTVGYETTTFLESRRTEVYLSQPNLTSQSGNITTSWVFPSDDEDDIKTNNGPIDPKPSKYNPHRPSFAGLTGGTWESYLEQKEPVGTTTTKNPVYVLSTTSSSPTFSIPIIAGNNPNRPSFAGLTGGLSENYVGQRVPNRTTTEKPINVISSSSSTTTTSRTSVILAHNPNRPSFAGATGGTWESYLEEKGPVGTTTTKNPVYVLSTTSSSPTFSIPIIAGNNPNRPSFAGLTGGLSENYVGQRVPNRTTTEEPINVISSSSSTTTTSRPSVILAHNPNRPSFAGATGGTWESYLEEKGPVGTTTTKNPVYVLSTTSSSPTFNIPIIAGNNPNRPSFAGLTGGLSENYVGQRVPNGTTTEKPINDISSSSASTTSRPSVILAHNSNRPSFAGATGGTWESYLEQTEPVGTSTTKNPVYVISTTSSSPTFSIPIIAGNNPNRPSFAGLTGGLSENYVGQRVPNGTTTEKPINDISSSSASTTSRPSVILAHNSNRPSFAGATGGTWESYLEQTEPVGTSTTKNPVYVLSSTSSSPTFSIPIIAGNNPNRPSFAGLTGGLSENYVGQRVPNGTTTVKPIKDISSSSSATTSSRPSTVLAHNSNRPSFAGLAGGTWESYVGQKIPASTSTENTTDILPNSNASTPSSSPQYVKKITEQFLADEKCNSKDSSKTDGTNDKD